MTCTAQGDFAAITTDAALCVYRIAQEALRNVIAHAGASRAEVKLLQVGDQAQITIVDDGRGFDAANPAERDTGLGLVSMSERARIIRGTVSIVSGLNQGTRVQATIPMHVCVKTEVRGMEGQVA
jgi:signal transduction histidine kinase